ncbi:bifunctional peptidase and arginyl-hydroxylase JMJD5 [Onthophagus taurus]|uniref:bifunctional peptidase and arginyl-hydroxylase JMJD5 n=1 Tax=Onthophagus taurus TaxID=166361 RepID=UPI000C209107|nr:lysine-specific demethylase 8 [Onthophagus taurus]
MEMKEEIVNYVLNKDEILNAVQLQPAFTLLYKTCFKCAFIDENMDENILNIDVVIDYLHDKLHTGHWSKVPISTRNGYAAASFIKALLLLKTIDEDSLSKSLKCLDFGILLGGPLPENPDLLQKAATRIHQSLVTMKEKSSISPPALILPMEVLKKYSNIEGEIVFPESLPSLETFIKNYFNPEIPVVITGAIQHWPASQKWLYLPYILKIFGERTVPIEIGSQYSDEDWSQQLMTFEEFVNKFYLNTSDQIGYLAQHDLFYQVPELKKEFSIPDYCSVSRSDENDEDVAINAWIGPEGTVSSLHFDPKDNLLAQLYGIKQIILFSPKDSDNLYPHPSEMLFNTSQVDPTQPDLEKFPNFKKAKPYKCLLQHGDMLYIPRKWWHHVTSYDRSFSINFWWS